jgi:hypothetical protein
VKRYYIGSTLAPAAGYMNMMAEPIPPPSYKSVEAKTGWVEREKLKYYQEAPLRPFTGSLTEVTVLDDEGGLVASMKGTGTSLAFFNWFNEQVRGSLDSSYWRSAVRLYAWYASDLFRVVGMEALRFRREVHPRFWHRNPCLVDPVAMLLPSATDRKRILLRSVYEYFGLTINFSDELSPTLQAGKVRELVLRTNLDEFTGSFVGGYDVGSEGNDPGE